MAIKRVFELADTTSSDVGVQGGAVSGFQLQPIEFLRTVVDAAKKQHYAAQFAKIETLSAGTKDLVIPRRMNYIGSGTTWGASTADTANEVNWTTINWLSGVTLTPSPKNYGVSITNYALLTNALNLVQEAREQLTYACGDEVDRAVFAAMNSDSNKATSSVSGTQAVYGGDATQASEIAAGDTITTAMVNEARRKLQSIRCRYWSYGTSEGVSTGEKNPWTREASSPFALLVAAEQEEAFLNDSQFVNAAEYGSDKIIHNGEIGDYLGVKVVVTDNVPYYAASVTHADASTTAVVQHRCVMIKSQKAVALAYGQKPKLTVFDYPNELQKRLVIEQSYQAKILFPDAIVHINVADV